MSLPAEVGRAAYLACGRNVVYSTIPTHVHGRAGWIPKRFLHLSSLLPNLFCLVVDATRCFLFGAAFFGSPFVVCDVLQDHLRRLIATIGED
jgi:hypothetical protein